MNRTWWEVWDVRLNVRAVAGLALWAALARARDLNRAARRPDGTPEPGRYAVRAAPRGA